MDSESDRLRNDKSNELKSYGNDGDGPVRPSRKSVTISPIEPTSWERQRPRRPIRYSNVRPSISDITESLRWKVDEEVPTPKRTWKQRGKFINLCWANFSAWACFALLAPFFPQEASVKGVSGTLVGFIFGVYELVIFLTAPVYGSMVNKVGPKFLFVAGVFVSGSCCILFGVLEYCPNGTIYIVMCILTRIVQALGSSAFMTACLTLAAQEFPEKVSFVVAILETFGGLGLMVGPTLGGAFYEAGGFGLPFYVMGGVLVLTGTFSWIFLVEEKTNEDDTGSTSMLKLLFNPGIFIVALTTVTAAFALAFLDPTLANRLEPFGLSTVLIGLVFLLAPAMYTIASLIWGWLADKYGHVYIYLVFGNLACTIAFMLLGPTPFLNLPYALWLNIISLCALGASIGCTFIMSYRGYITIAFELGLEQNLATYGCISGLFNSGFSLGAFLGPTLGGVLDEQLGFPWACSVCGLLCVPVSFITLIYFFIIPRCCGSRSKTTANSTRDLNEEDPLMSSLQTSKGY